MVQSFRQRFTRRPPRRPVLCRTASPRSYPQSGHCGKIVLAGLGLHARGDRMGLPFAMSQRGPFLSGRGGAADRLARGTRPGALRGQDGPYRPRDSLRISEHVCLPDAYHLPADSAKQAGGPTIARNICGDLPYPVFRIAPFLELRSQSWPARPCQKSPSQKTTTRTRGKTISGFPGSSRVFLRKRVASRQRADRNRASARVPLDRLARLACELALEAGPRPAKEGALVNRARVVTMGWLPLPVDKLFLN